MPLTLIWFFEGLFSALLSSDLRTAWLANKTEKEVEWKEFDEQHRTMYELWYRRSHSCSILFRLLLPIHIPPSDLKMLRSVLENCNEIFTKDRVILFDDTHNFSRKHWFCCRVTRLEIRFRTFLDAKLKLKTTQKSFYRSHSCDLRCRARNEFGSQNLSLTTIILLFFSLPCVFILLLVTEVVILLIYRLLFATFSKFYPRLQLMHPICEQFQSLRKHEFYYSSCILGQKKEGEVSSGFSKCYFFGKQNQV